MIGEVRDPELRSAREAWQAPTPRSEMHERILRNCERELRRSWRRWGLAAAAAVVLVGALSVSRVEMRRQSAVIVARETPKPVVVEQETPRPHVAARKAVKRAVRKPVQPLARFYSLMEAPPPLGNGVLIRVIVPASTLQITGLPMGDGQVSGNVEADVLIGEDGMARAIRFPGFE